MICLLQKLGLGYYDHLPVMFSTAPSSWFLMPILESKTASSLIQSDLGQVLAQGLERVRLLDCNIGPICFLGMDSPELRMDEIKYALDLCSRESKRAYMCPTDDGGYGLLCLPKAAPKDVFSRGVRWSDPLTAVSQAKAITDEMIDITFGMIMHDVDVPEDVTNLITRLLDSEQDDVASKKGDVLSEFHPNASFDSMVPKHCACPFTLSSLIDLGLIKR
jgi:hypothetical protein